MIDKTTVSTLDVPKYMGTWYEIARFQHSFEKNLVGVSANYTMRSDGRIDVLNQGHVKTLNGKLKQAKGVAKRAGDSTPGKLKVSFFLFFYADYNILELDTTNYQWVIVGSQTSNYLWIMSRNPQMPEPLYNELVEKARKRGYDVSKLYRVPQAEPSKRE